MNTSMLLLQIITTLPQLIGAGVQVAGLLSKAQALLDTGTDPTQEQLDELKAERDALIAQINQG